MNGRVIQARTLNGRSSFYTRQQIDGDFYDKSEIDALISDFIKAVVNEGMGTGIFDKVLSNVVYLKSFTSLTNILTIEPDPLFPVININIDTSKISHKTISDIGILTHDQIDSHINDASIHFTQSQIDHTLILNKGTKTHAQIDTHISSIANPHNTTLLQILTAGNRADGQTIIIENIEFTHIIGNPSLQFFNDVFIKANEEILTLEAVKNIQLKRLTQVNEYGVGIGVDILPYDKYHLHIDSEGFSDISAYWRTPSDARLRTDIIDCEGLIKLLQLLPRKFKFISDVEQVQHYGFIAQEFELIYPECVTEVLIGGEPRKTINLEPVLPCVVKAIKEINNRLDSIEQRLTAHGI